MKSLVCISLGQPYAGLVAAGIKRFETRSGPPAGDMRPWGVKVGVGGHKVNAGDRIGIASTLKLNRFAETHDHIGGGYYVGDQIIGGDGAVMRHVNDEHHYGCTLCEDPDDGRLSKACKALNEWEPALLRDEGGHGMSVVCPLPAGHLLATAVVAECLPVIGMETQMDEPNYPDRHIWRFGERGLTIFERGDGEWSQDEIGDQLPFGHWDVGRWAWALTDIRPVTDECPACHGTGCDVCDGAGSLTSTLPLAGMPGTRQGLWALPWDVSL